MNKHEAAIADVLKHEGITFVQVIAQMEKRSNNAKGIRCSGCNAKLGQVHFSKSITHVCDGCHAEAVKVVAEQK